jgi:hypothetical protein
MSAASPTALVGDPNQPAVDAFVYCGLYVFGGEPPLGEIGVRDDQ